MLNVDDYLQIRLLHRDGVSAREIARRLGHGRDTVKKALVEATPRGYTRTRPVNCPKLGAFTAAIDQILADDRAAPKKQRHTAHRIFERLRDDHQYLGGYDQVRRYVSSHRKRERETHLMLDHPPGCRMECDFGHIQVDFPEGRRLVPVLIAVWSYSHYPFVIALPNERTESILHGTVCAFEFFGCVPAELWWDNPTTVATAIIRGRDRQLNSNYAALASHYRFAPMFCMPARGQEKSDVERTVFALQRRFATPVPCVKDVDELNRHLLGCCLKERQRTVSGRNETIGQMFEAERRNAVELPARPFDACMQSIRQADKYQTVLFEDVRYSVPRQVAFEPVTVKAYLDQVVLVHRGQIVARHRRSRVAGDQVLEPTHFLAVLERKPAYLDKTRLFKELKLPAAFGQLRERFTKELGERTGTRHYIRVMQLLGRHSAEQIAKAIEACLNRQMLRAEFIVEKMQSSPAGVAPTGASPAGGSPVTETSNLNPSITEALPRIAHFVHVPPPDLRRFDQLLIHQPVPQPKGDCDHVPSHPRDAAQTQPQDAAAADDVGGIRQAVA